LAAGYIFKGLFDKNGVVNKFLELFIGGQVDIAWLGDLRFALIVIALGHSWKWLGIPLLVYIAGLNTIPEELVQAARIDGAGFWRIVRNVKIPLLGPSFTFNVTVTLVGALSVFDIILSTTKGGPGRATEVLTLFILSQYANGNFGYAVSINLVLFFVIVVVAIPLITYLRKREIEL
jgi:ABC-type sugar transport system permease subunit